MQIAGAHNRVLKPGVALDRDERGVECCLDGFEGVLHLFCAGGDLVEVVEAGSDHLDEQSFFVGEVAIEDAFADAGMLGDVTHMRLFASECEEFACGGDDSLAVAASVGT